MYELIICEKPDAAKKIAEALADGKPIKENINGVPYYKVTRGKKDIVVACAVGHLYGLAEKGKKTWTYPVFDIEWKPISEINKKSAFSKKYLAVLKKLCKEANEFTVSTDFDIEGETIGFNIIRFACKKKDANRMKFSTLTKPDLIEAYENKMRHLDWGQANAGETRHFLDFFNGVSYSRALTSSIKAAGSFKLMSTGRVQGPALKIIVDREKEIKAFKPVPFWQIELNGDVNKGQIIAWHKEDKFWEKSSADEVIKKTKGAKEAIIESAEKRQYQQAPPTPFDLTTLQIEAYRCHRISPKETLQIAQELYTSGFISYPRTSSQILSEKLGFRKIFSELQKQKNYSDLISKLLSKKSLQPNNGKKTDPAHPAIYPTGITPHLSNEREARIYDLIVKRFMATFSEPATRETMTIEISCKDEIFIAKGTRTTEKGWHVFYQPYVNIEEEELPAVNKNDKVIVKKIKLHEKETQPPKRYTPASIIKELEKRNLGTKATRSEIVDTLFNRGYVTGKAIEATNLGIKTVETLEQYAPKIVDEELTRHFEEEMEEIREGKRKGEEVLEEAKEAITNIIVDFKKKEKDIGKKLLEANIETRDALSNLGKCPVCREGDLHMRKGKFGSFVACNQYPKCKTTFSLPKNALIKPAQKSCDTCSFPKVLAIKKGKKPMEFCLNPKCPTKHVEGDAGKEAKAIAKGEIEKSCPECKEGKLVLRGSIYGKFYGCSLYPKCKYTEKLGEGPLKEDFTKK
ncbi:DNA topoisomerase I [Candidatus Woesearchaeota archaeon]|nr:DNA topoisomerase I [Candidatus Woesearchaeota archaeon]